MVHVTFYSTKAQKNLVYKTLGTGFSANAELYENTNILNPELKLAWNSDYATKYNYFYIQEFSRYYFIDDVIAETGGAVRIKGSVDVLYTYRTLLESTPLIITRAQDSYLSTTHIGAPTYIRDNKFPIMPQRHIYVSQFKKSTPLTNGDTSYCYVLNVMGRTPT